MSRVALALGLLAAVVVVATVTARRQPRRAAPARTRAAVPAQLHRADFPHADAPWLAVLFSSSTCASCAPMAEKVRALASDDVGVAVVEFTEQRALHERYGIDAVPLVVVVDADGVTRASFAGTVSAAELWAAVAALRDG